MRERDNVQGVVIYVCGEIFSHPKKKKKKEKIDKVFINNRHHHLFQEERRESYMENAGIINFKKYYEGM